MSHRTQDKRVAQAVKPVLLQSLLLRDNLINRVGSNVVGDRAMKGRVEECDRIGIW